MSEETAYPSFDLRDALEQELEDQMSGRGQAKQEARYIVGAVRRCLRLEIGASRLPAQLRDILEQIDGYCEEINDEINDY